MVSGTYTSEDFFVTFTAKMDRTDYGVQGSPVWYEVDSSSVKVEAVEILGVEVEMKDLPFKLQAAIHNLNDEVEFEDENQ